MSRSLIVIEQFPNDLIREFHVNERISSEKLHELPPGAAAIKHHVEAGRVTIATVQTALSFYDIEGVTSVGLDVYAVRIAISPAFDWDEITPQVIDLIKQYLVWDDVEIRARDSRTACGSLGEFGDIDPEEEGECES